MSRIKLLICVGIVGWIAFMLMEFYAIGHIPDIVSVIFFAVAGLALVVMIIAPAIIGVRRQERMIAKGVLQPGAVVSVPARVKSYLFIATITLVSVAIQILHGFPIHRPTSALAWNLAVMVAVIVLIEGLYRLRNSRR